MVVDMMISLTRTMKMMYVAMTVVLVVKYVTMRR
jgi:hypothetical protein